MMRQLRTAALLVATAAIVAACGGNGGSSTTSSTKAKRQPVNPMTVVATTRTVTSAIPKGTIVLTLDPQNRSGVGGTATLVRHGDTTEVQLALTGNKPGEQYPAHIHQGTCAKLTPTPRYPLQPVINGLSNTTVQVSLKDLQSSPYAVNVHDPKAPTKYVACADIS